MALPVSVMTAIEGGYITGINDGSIVARLEIDEFALDSDLLNLFILALERVQATDARDPWSWFQIAGIHGEPSTPWDHIETLKRVQQAGYAGYCSHSSVTFPTWHRPYLSMMEQAIYNAMTIIAGNYTDETHRQRYSEACKRFRFPYWDPCSPRQLNFGAKTSTTTQPQFGIPLIVSQPTLFVRRPEAPNKLRAVQNPLFQYYFPTDIADVEGATNFWEGFQQNSILSIQAQSGTSHTVRAPDDSGKTDDSYINSQLSSKGPTQEGSGINQIGGSLYNVLTSPRSWTSFSNDTTDSPGLDEAFQQHVSYVYQSVEGFHDNLHMLIGQGTLTSGSGHMSTPQYAAFDPMFWLHHCNIDRITALWQAQRAITDSSSWWSESNVGETNRSTEAGTAITPRSPLIPFRRSLRTNDQSLANVYTSEDIRDWTKLGYTYLVKRISHNTATNQNELVTTPLRLGDPSSANYKKYFNQFYLWFSTSAGKVPDLIQQFYPIDLSHSETLTGRSLVSPVPPPVAVPRPPDLSTIPEPISQPGITPTPQETPKPPVTTPPITTPPVTTPPVTTPPVTTPPFVPPPQLNLPSHPERLPPGFVPHTDEIDYDFPPSVLEHGNRLRQWDLHIVAEKFKLNDSYQVLIFLGPFNPTHPSAWPTAEPNLVGINGIFANNAGASGNCDNCATQAQSGLVVEDVMPLTQHLLRWIRSGEKCPPRR